MKRNILLFILVLVMSFATASYFGSLYNYFVPQDSSSMLGASKDTAIFTAGIFFSYVFLVPLIFELFGMGSKKKWIVVSLVPVILFYLSDNIKLVYIPILTAIIGFLLAKIINFLISKFKHPNPPMVVK